MTLTHCSVAIIGAGPSGCYLADTLGRKLTTARIDIFDRLPTPFGLVRGGVAPDHQGTKNIARQFERTLAKEGVRFLGNVEIGKDISVAELQQAYDIIVIATGALVDRTLGIPGDTLDGVYGSGAFVSWYNGIPDGRDLAPSLAGKSVAIVGNGNVALDIARLLAKIADELATSDLCAHARDVFSAAPIRDIWLIGRRGPLDASFTSTELAELGQLARVQPIVDATQLPRTLPADISDEKRKIAEKNLEVLRDYGGRPPTGEKSIRLHFVFFAVPVAIRGSSDIATLELERTRVEQDRVVLTGERWTIAANTIITAIGYRSREIPGLPFDVKRGTIAHEQGRVAPGVYAVGWCKRGPQGVVPANRTDALAMAELIVDDLKNREPTAAETAKAGNGLIDALLAERKVHVVDIAGWQRINAAETAAGIDIGRPREKLTRIADLLAAADVQS
jgi:NADPH-dependent glutamate synthase beta subunit-like oxidoreductase